MGIARSLAWASLAFIAALHLAGSRVNAAIRPAESVIASWPQQSRHHLVGKIWLARDRRLIDGISLSRGLLVGSPIAEALGLKTHSYILLGEVHDNAEHHLLRAGLIGSITDVSASGRNISAAVVSEHINAGQAAGLASFNDLASTREGRPAKAADLFRLLQWEKTGWPKASLFEPLYEAVIEARLPLSAGDVARDRIRAVARGGPSVLDPGESARLALDRVLEIPLAEALAAEIKGSHCGMLPDSAVPGMAFAQRYRDAHLAQAIIDARRGSARAILLAGNGHVRADRGVPWYLRARERGTDIFTLLLIEVEDGKSDAEAYLPRAPDGKPAADAVIFTPRADREDPCARMRQQMQKKD